MHTKLIIHNRSFIMPHFASTDRMKNSGRYVACRGGQVFIKIDIRAWAEFLGPVSRHRLLRHDPTGQTQSVSGDLPVGWGGEVAWRDQRSIAERTAKDVYTAPALWTQVAD